jgi:lipopolysaccharide export system permease protein
VRILDRQRYWSFLKAYVICYVSLVGLYIVIDAFSNLDEFYKRADGLTELAQVMFRYYFVHQSLFFDQLCGVIGMMAAVFTVTWMQRNNEQLAMLAAGISTHRAIRPVLVSSVIVSFFAVGNQELIMPRFAEELAKTHDDDGTATVHVSGRLDPQEIFIHGVDADRATQTIFPFYATLDVPVLGSIHDLKGRQATYIPPDHPTAPITGGWLVRGASINPAIEDEQFRASQQVLFRVENLKGFPPPYVPPNKEEAQPGISAAAFALAADTAEMIPHSELLYFAMPQPLLAGGNIAFLQVNSLLDRKVDVSHGTFFLKSSLTFQAMTRKTKWYQFAPTRDLLLSLSDPSTAGSERVEVAVFVHGRILRPVLGMNLLFMSLPLVLGGYGRNTFINLGFALGNSAIFYGAILCSSYLGTFRDITPELSAWLPLMIFAAIAAYRWGQIRT